MEKYPLSKRPSKDLINIEGTRYHRVALINNSECLYTGIVSTPLTKEELESFVVKRIGYSTCTFFASEILGSAVRDNKGGAPIGLSTFEADLKSFVPEVVVETVYAKITRTNKGTTVQMPIDPETGEIKGDE